MSNENERNNTLFVFVGEKIEVKDIPYEKGDFDLGVKAKYKVLQSVYGNYDKDTISFEAYDHKGEPAFAKYKNVLMFVSESTEKKGQYYMEKYQYFDVYKTKDGRWASSYKAEDYKHLFNKQTTVKPEKIDFVSEVSYPDIIKNASGPDDTLSYPEPYYRVSGNKAIAVYGNHIEDLFRLKKEGVLTARKLFGNREIENEIVPLAEVPAEIVNSDVSKGFVSFWKLFTKVVKERNTDQFKKMVFDTIWTPCNTVKPSKLFIKHCFDSVFNNSVAQKLSDTSLTKFSWVELDQGTIQLFTRKQAIKEDALFKLRTVKIESTSAYKKQWWLSLGFVKTNKGFKLYECNYQDNGKCCQ